MPNPGLGPEPGARAPVLILRAAAQLRPSYSRALPDVSTATQNVEAAHETEAKYRPESILAGADQVPFWNYAAVPALPTASQYDCIGHDTDVRYVWGSPAAVVRAGHGPNGASRRASSNLRSRLGDLIAHLTPDSCHRAPPSAPHTDRNYREFGRLGPMVTKTGGRGTGVGGARRWCRDPLKAMRHCSLRSVPRTQGGRGKADLGSLTASPQPSGAVHLAVRSWRSLG